MRKTDLQQQTDLDDVDPKDIEQALQEVRAETEEERRLDQESALEELAENNDQAEGTMPGNPDPLLALAGTLKYEATDLSERHDEYIGKALLAEMREDVRPLK